MRERLAGHLAVGRKRHFEFGTSRRRGGERLTVKESCLDVARCHGFRTEGGICDQERACDDECFCPHLKPPDYKMPIALEHHRTTAVPTMEQ